MEMVKHAMIRNGLNPSIMDGDHNKPASLSGPGIPLFAGTLPEFGSTPAPNEISHDASKTMEVVKHVVARGVLESSALSGDCMRSSSFSERVLVEGAASPSPVPASILEPPTAECKPSSASVKKDGKSAGEGHFFLVAYSQLILVALYQIAHLRSVLQHACLTSQWTLASIHRDKTRRTVRKWTAVTKLQLEPLLGTGASVIWRERELTHIAVLGYTGILCKR
jgi:hypothetical protein